MSMTRRLLVSAAGAGAIAHFAPVAAAEDVEANKAAAKRWAIEALGKGNLAVLDDLISPDYQPPHPADAPGIDAYKTRLQANWQAVKLLVPDAAYTLADVAGEGDLVFIRGTIAGTTQQGAKVAATHLAEFRFKAGKIVSDWRVLDLTALSGR